MTSKITESAMAMSKLPFVVSITVAVVSTRVWPRMLPPTIIEAPISEMTPPNPAMTAASIGRLAARCPDRDHLEPEHRRDLLDGRESQPRHDRRCDDELGDHDRRGRVEQLE